MINLTLKEKKGLTPDFSIVKHAKILPPNENLSREVIIKK
jgi:hypothetical protein